MRIHSGLGDLRFECTGNLPFALLLQAGIFAYRGFDEGGDF